MATELKDENVQGTTPVGTESTATNGTFFNSLRRTNKEIKEARALSISEDAEMLYKRKVEDIARKIRQKRRDRENMLDMSPENTTSLKLASDFNAEEWTEKYIQLGVDIRNLEIQLNIAKEGYEYLFGQSI